MFHRVRQQLAGLLLAGVTGALHAAMPAVDCPGPTIRFEALAPDLWLLPAQAGDAGAGNRGVVSNLLLARDAGRWWLLGSGPSPAHGRAVACQVQRRFGQAITDVVSPWARPELVLGQRGLPTARRWAHAEVAEAMRVQCPGCVARLRERLEGAAADLGDDPIAVPDRLLHGASGRLGPFDWWLLPRSAGRFVTVWRHRASHTWAAHGLLWAASPGDGRDADLALLQHGLRQIAALAAASGADVRWVGEQGAAQAAGAPLRQADYWRDLEAAVGAALDAGADESAPAQALPGWPAEVSAHAWHRLNWQRAWRQLEARRFDAAPR